MSNLSGVESDVLSIGLAKRTLPIAADMILLPAMWFIELYLMSHVNINAIAVFGLVAQIITLAFTFFFTLNVGTSILILKYKHDNQYKTANIFFSHTVVVAVYLSIFMGTIFYFSIPYITNRFAIVDVTIDSFLELIAFAFPFMGFNFIFIGLLRSCGEGEKSFLINLVITSANLIPLLIYFQNKELFITNGMKFAGFCLLFSNLIGTFLIILLSLFNVFKLKLNIKNFIKLRLAVVKSVFIRSFYLGTEQILWASGQTYLTFLAGYFSPVILAAHNIVRSIQSLITMIYQGIGINFFVHYNNMSDKVKLFKKVLLQTFFIVVGITIILIFFYKYIISFFVNSSVYNKLSVMEFSRYIKNALFVMLSFQFFKALNIIVGYGLKQNEKLKWLLLITVITTVFFVFLGGIFLPEIFSKSIIVIWVIIGIDETFKAVMNAYKFRKEVII